MNDPDRYLTFPVCSFNCISHQTGCWGWGWGGCSRGAPGLPPNPVLRGGTAAVYLRFVSSCMEAGRNACRPHAHSPGASLVRGTFFGSSHSTQTSKAGDRHHCSETPVAPYNLEHVLSTCVLPMGSSTYFTGIRSLSLSSEGISVRLSSLHSTTQGGLCFWALSGLRNLRLRWTTWAPRTLQ